MLTYNKKVNEIVEDSYLMQNERQAGSLFTTGNGYLGIRGSFEEYGSIGVQGAFVRGLFDEIYELPDIGIDNIYMRKYYFDEEKARTFEKQDSCINFCDFLLIRFRVGDYVFYPWEGIVLDWIRYIDTEDGSLIRKVYWEDPEGNKTRFYFKRNASFENDHVYLMEASLKKINHDLPVEIISGVDTITKTNHQIKTKMVSYENDKHDASYLFHMGDKYNHQVGVHIHNDVEHYENVTYETLNDGRFVHRYRVNDEATKVSIKKMIYVGANIDGINVSSIDTFSEVARDAIRGGYHSLFELHKKKYRETFSMLNIKIQGNIADDAYLRYANYQTLIAANRNDSVHGLSAKNLTGEKYNQFVWWDAEIYQLPIFMATLPDVAKQSILYRYHRLEQSKGNAKEDGYEGAKFAFCSSVLGDEKVWPYVRHPFMQIHINSDIAYSIIRYVIITGDVQFLKDYGFEMLIEIMTYFLSRSTYIDKKNHYEFYDVTGTDEHHPYVDNNAYTNVMVAYTAKKMIQWFDKYDVDPTTYTTKKRWRVLRNFAENLYVPDPIGGVTPQFDGYFDLSPNLKEVGKGIGKGFQMKTSGLYHLSQIIKQPDVMMLHTYVNVDYQKTTEKKDWVFYEEKCEKSSSLSYPAHAIAAIDNHEYDKFHEYLMQSIKIDIDDLHQVAEKGLHGACMAGGWYAIYRGMFGIKEYEDYLQISPSPKGAYPYEKVSLRCVYHGTVITLVMDRIGIIISADRVIPIKYKEQNIEQKKDFKYAIK